MVKPSQMKKTFVSTTYGNEDNISKKINNPHFKDLELLYGQKYELISTKREIRMDLPLQSSNWCSCVSLSKIKDATILL